MKAHRLQRIEHSSLDSAQAGPYQKMDGTTASWRDDFLEERWDGKIPTYAQVRAAPWKYTEYQTDTPELYNETTDPFELTNVVTDPANAGTVATLAAGLRVLRPAWPASPSGAFVEP